MCRSLKVLTYAGTSPRSFMFLTSVLVLWSTWRQTPITFLNQQIIADLYHVHLWQSFCRHWLGLYKSRSISENRCMMFSEIIQNTKQIFTAQIKCHLLLPVDVRYRPFPFYDFPFLGNTKCRNKPLGVTEHLCIVEASIGWWSSGS